MNLSSHHTLSPTDAQQLQNYNDLHSLQSLKYGSSNREAQIEAVSKQFESMFVSLLLKSMRSANDVFAQDNPLNSQQVKFYQDMYDSQLAVSLSNTRGIGLAEVIQRQLSMQAGSVKASDFEGNDGYAIDHKPRNSSFGLDGYVRRDFGIGAFKNPVTIEQVKETVNVIQETISEADLEGEQGSVTIAAGHGTEQIDFSSPESFVNSLLPYAKQVEAETGIDARLMLAQSALETGWGQHQILRSDGRPSFNLFGIKANTSWEGESAEITTTEYRSGVALKERAEFRAYGSYEQSFRDYADFLNSNARYADALEHREDPVRFAHALQESGYATDPSYGNKIESILGRLGQNTNPASRSAGP